MNGIIYPAIVMGGLGIIFGALLAYASRKFFVEVDPRQSQIREILPGANCGGCGFPGCDGFAEAVAGFVLKPFDPFFDHLVTEFPQGGLIGACLVAIREAKRGQREEQRVAVRMHASIELTGREHREEHREEETNHR